MSDSNPNSEVVAAIDESDLLKSESESKPPRPTKTRYGVLGFTLALTAIAYLDRARISVAAPVIKADLGLTDGQMGYIFSAFTFAYALFEIPSGWMADRFGPRLTLVRIVICWSIMSAFTGIAMGFWSLFFIRLLFGMGEAGTFPSISRVYVRWLPIQEHGRAFGLALMAGALGSAASQPLIATLLGLKFIVWRDVFPMFSILGITWAILWFWWFRDDPHEHPSVNQNELKQIGCAPPVRHSAVPWKHLLRNRSLLALCLLCASWLYGWYFWLMWLPTYLLEARGFNLKAAGLLSALPLLAAAVGMLAGGWLSDILVRRWGLRKGRRTPGVVCLPLAAITIIVAIMAPTGIGAALLLSLAAGLSAMGITPIFAVCLEIGGRHAGVVSGTMNMVGNLGGTLSPTVAGLCVERLHSWNIPLIIVAGFYLVAAVCWLVVDPTDPIQGAH